MVLRFDDLTYKTEEKRIITYLMKIKCMYAKKNRFFIRKVNKFLRNLKH